MPVKLMDPISWAVDNWIACMHTVSTMKLFYWYCLHLDGFRSTWSPWSQLLGLPHFTYLHHSLNVEGEFFKCLLFMLLSIMILTMIIMIMWTMKLMITKLVVIIVMMIQMMMMIGIEIKLFWCKFKWWIKQVRSGGLTN